MSMTSISLLSTTSFQSVTTFSYPQLEAKLFARSSFLAQNIFNSGSYGRSGKNFAA